MVIELQKSHHDDAWETYDEHNQIKFKISKLGSGLCKHSDVYIRDVYILLKGIMIRNYN